MTSYFRTPKPSDCEKLSALVLESKASHGYSSAFMAACVDELRVTPQTLENGTALSIWDCALDTPLGFIQLIPTQGDVCELEALFISSLAQGRGLGRSLFEWAVDTALKQGHHAMTINADPGAEAFYLKLGAKRIGEIPSGSIPGRLLPRLAYRLTNGC